MLRIPGPYRPLSGTHSAPDSRAPSRPCRSLSRGSWGHGVLPAGPAFPELPVYRHSRYLGARGAGTLTRVALLGAESPGNARPSALPAPAGPMHAGISGPSLPAYRPTGAYRPTIPKIRDTTFYFALGCGPQKKQYPLAPTNWPKQWKGRKERPQGPKGPMGSGATYASTTRSPRSGLGARAEPPSSTRRA